MFLKSLQKEVKQMKLLRKFVTKLKESRVIEFIQIVREFVSLVIELKQMQRALAW